MWRNIFIFIPEPHIRNHLRYNTINFPYLIYTDPITSLFQFPHIRYYNLNLFGPTYLFRSIRHPFLLRDFIPKFIKNSIKPRSRSHRTVIMNNPSHRNYIFCRRFSFSFFFRELSFTRTTGSTTRNTWYSWLNLMVN